MRRSLTAGPINHLRLAILLMLAAFAILPASALAASPSPLGIQRTSLGQNGRYIVWRVRAEHAFYPRAMARHHRSLCLLMHQGSGTSANHEVCLAGHRRGQRGPRLVYRLTDGTRTTIPSKIVRKSSSQLTARFMPTAVGMAYRRLRWQVISTLRPAGCAAPTVGYVSDCEKVIRTPKRVRRLHTPRPIRCTATGPELVNSGPSTQHEIALTFDDGPDNAPPTMDFVNLLHQLNVPATFFEIGRQIPTYDPTGSIERKMLAYGDMIGDHTWNHPFMPSLSAAQQTSEILMTSKAIHNATGFTPCLFRAPYGAVNSKLLNLVRSLGFTTIGWDIDPRDWALPGTQAIYQNVVNNAHNGAIVLQHFGGGPRYETLAALPQEISTLRARGYQFVTVTQLLGYKVVYR